MKSFGILTVSIIAGLLLGMVIRRARMPAPLSGVEARAQLPSRERINASLLRAEIRDLDARLAALREESDGVERERLRLAALSEPPPPPSPEALVRSGMRSMLGDRTIAIEGVVLEWLNKDPRNIGILLAIAAEVYREKDWGRFSYSLVQQYLSYFVGNLDGEAKPKMMEFLIGAQRTETDLLRRGWMLSMLASEQIGLPGEQIGELARLFGECKDPRFRESAFAMILKDAPSYPDLIRSAIREGSDLDERCRHLLQAWDKRAIPGGELRNLARDLMKSDNPGVLIMEAQDWVPRFINPLAPQETVALFDQTLAKPIEPLHKAISVMVMGSIATLFPSHPGRAEIERFVNSTEDANLKAFAGKVGVLIDEGKSYAEIRQLNPRQYGFELPK